MKPRPALLAIVALPLALHAQAQGNSSRSPDSAAPPPQERAIDKLPVPSKATPDPGMIVVPPKVDPEAIKTPSEKIDPEITKPPPATAKKKPKQSKEQRQTD